MQHSPVTLQPGQYTFTLYMQGEGTSGRISVTAADGSELASADFAGTQWGDWQQPSLTFTLTEETVVTPGILLDIQPGGWGAVDDLYLGKLGDQAVEPTPAPLPRRTTRRIQRKTSKLLRSAAHLNPQPTRQRNPRQLPLGPLVRSPRPVTRCQWLYWCCWRCFRPWRCWALLCCAGKSKRGSEPRNQNATRHH